MPVRMGVVRCVVCGAVVRYVRAGLPTPDGPGEQCGAMEWAEGRLDDWEVAVRACRERDWRARGLAIQHALPGQFLIQATAVRYERAEKDKER